MSEAAHEIRQQPARAPMVVGPKRRVSHGPDEEGHDEEAHDSRDREDHKFANQVSAAGR